MNYKKILKNIAEKEKISVKEVEKEMLVALRAAGMTCSVKVFLENTVKDINSRLYIV